MSQTPEFVRQSNFLNQEIIDRTTTEELGRVEVLWIYVPKHRVLGFVGKAGLLGNKKFAFKLDQVRAVGESIVTQGSPEETTPDRVKRLESLMNHEVWTDDGERLGKITDCVFNLKTGEITHYLFVSSDISGILGSIYQVSPRWISSIGERRVLLSGTATIEPYRESLPQKITKTAENLKEEAVQEWRSITHKATEQIQQLRSQMKERTQEVSERLREESERLREEAQVLAERAKEQSQTLAEQVKEQSQIISRQLEEGIQTLTVQAEEIFDRSDEPQTLQYSYNEEDFDWDWDELDEEQEEQSNAQGNSQKQSARQSFNTFVDRKQSHGEGDRSPSPSTKDAPKVVDASRLVNQKVNPIESEDSNLDDFDFDDDFWMDEPAPDRTKEETASHRPESVQSEPVSDRPPVVLPNLTLDDRSPVPPPNQTQDSTDLDDEPWI
ncbi:PRC-barrel domain-containing protein [Leptolyngbya ohadii]|uniref:PRC-barrel domain containing protein n=1 Tax=Leptolyngbya ohadii TaxID=1962290 RepID=UPI000B59B113|nr:PRC-barrel domain-containing protein [Leptolyngbya ohadii]